MLSAMLSSPDGHPMAGASRSGGLRAKAASATYGQSPRPVVSLSQSLTMPRQIGIHCGRLTASIFISPATAQEAWKSGVSASTKQPVRPKVNLNRSRKVDWEYAATSLSPLPS